jgi:hypothetical protein
VEPPEFIDRSSFYDGAAAFVCESYGHGAKMSEELQPVASGMSLRKLTREQDKAEQRVYWLRRSARERLAAATKLTKQLYRLRGIDLDERKTDFTVSRVRRGKG